MSKNQVFSFICFGIALFFFLFGSLEKIKLVADAPGALSDQKALEVAKGRGLWPILATFRMRSHIDFEIEANEFHLVRYVDVAYLGNIMIMILFFIAGILLLARKKNRNKNPTLDCENLTHLDAGYMSLNLTITSFTHFQLF